MDTEKKKKKKLVSRLRNKYRLVFMNDETFEEKASLRLSPINVFVFIGTVVLTLITLVIYLIAFTPLREYIPGYADLGMQRNIYHLTFLADSLEQEMASKDQYINNLNRVVNGTVGDHDSVSAKTPSQPQVIGKPNTRSPEDSMLRVMIESGDRYELTAPQQKSGRTTDISSFFFFTPVKGTITNTFKTIDKHFGIDVVAAQNEAIKATLDGTVILATWTNDAGYVIAIQHSNNLVSVYKHNSVLLKKAGVYVKAGEAVAIIGNSGEYSTGPHLHFELWFNGSPVNPKDYISF